MMRRLTSAIVVLLLVLTMVVAVGCGAPDKPDDSAEKPGETKEPAEEPKETTEEEIVDGGTFKMWVYWEAATINPVLANGVWFPTYYGFDPLFKYSPTGEMIPALAESWEVSEDGLVYTFHLRTDVKWHDGEPFTAEDVKFTVDTILDEDTRTTIRGGFILDGTPIEVKVVDDYTVEFHLPQPFAPFMVVLGEDLRMIPKHLLADVEDINNADFNLNPVGTGPFKFVEWSSGSHVLMEKNEDYYKPVHLDKILLKIIPNAESNVLAFENQEIDTSYLYDVDAIRFQEVEGVNVYNVPAGYSAYLWLNVRKPTFNDKLVRQAVAYALDKETIGQTVTQGISHASYSIYPAEGPYSWVHNPDAPKYKYNVEKAKELLAEAGWQDTDGDGIVEKDGKDFEFLHYGQTGFKQYEKVNVMIQSQLEEVGIEMEIRLLEPSAFREALLSTEDPKPQDSHLTGRSPISRWDPDFFATFHSSEYPEGQNPYGYSSPEADELLELGRTTVERSQRKEIYMELQDVIMEDIPYIPLYSFINSTGVWDYLGGVPEDKSLPPDTILYYAPEELYLKNLEKGQ